MKSLLKSVLARLGYRISRIPSGSTVQQQMPVEFSPADAAIVERVLERQLTMVSRERLYATLMACRHVLTQEIPGDFVECGVWRGGNSLIAADVFAREGAQRGIHLFDTFAGMTEPTADDVKARDGGDAMPEYLAAQRGDHNEWCYASLEDVQRNFAEAKLLGPRVRFVRGDVVESLKNPANVPGAISVLRLDTDWYESTRAELEVLYPRLSPGGVLILDDYGHWGGAKKAVDEYFRNRPRPLLQYTDYTGRMGVKLR
ncbi:MAG: TylF/MycF family methyltransferase [Betaproteobacteria bacterium]|nr:TylF/MycF family methyltransferase [Betaproteobacteria bacterium]MDH5220467.1 TylF/MycF family methyltransferase [Betaproteobacteria bacterium]MDH5350168.1 TylF/MycF family methyltransferase [Betaproteobacteria bacterium]